MMKRKATIATVTTLAVCIATALAYYLITYTFSGEGSSTAGKGAAVAEPLTVAMGAGITPSNTVPLTLTTNLAAEHTLQPGAKLTVTFTTSSPECKPAWFSVTVTGTESTELLKLLGAGAASSNVIKSGPQSVAVAYRPIAGTATLNVSMKEEAAVNQSACESATITAHAVLTGTTTS